MELAEAWMKEKDKVPTQIMQVGGCAFRDAQKLVRFYKKKEVHEIQPTLLQYRRLWSFQMGDTKLERFFPKKEFWINGELSKSSKNLTFNVNFLCQRSFMGIFLIFFSLKNTNLLLLTFFDKTNF